MSNMKAMCLYSRVLALQSAPKESIHSKSKWSRGKVGGLAQFWPIHWLNWCTPYFPSGPLQFWVLSPTKGYTFGEVCTDMTWLVMIILKSCEVNHECLGIWRHGFVQAHCCSLLMNPTLTWIECVFIATVITTVWLSNLHSSPKEVHMKTTLIFWGP